MSAPIATDVSDAGLNFIAHFEGCRLKPYNDPAPGGGNATIGIGHMIHKGPVTHADELEYANFTPQDALDLLRAERRRR